MGKTKKKRSVLRRVLAVLGCIILFAVVAGGIGYGRSRGKSTREYKYTDSARIVEDVSQQGVGNVEVTTLKLPKEIAVQRASYGFSDRVIVVYREKGQMVIATVHDDGSDMRIVFRGSSSGNSRLLPFWDNKRILLGDNVLECPEGYTLDDCPEAAAKLVPIVFPEEFSKGKEVMDKWTEVIISPDNEYIAWTIRRTDCGAVNAMGRLARTENNYTIMDAEYISNMNAFRPDPERAGYSLYTPVIGGEVKQFVHGGRAISLVGAASNGMADSVVQDVATGEVT